MHLTLKKRAGGTLGNIGCKLRQREATLVTNCNRVAGKLVAQLRLLAVRYSIHFSSHSASYSSYLSVSLSLSQRVSLHSRSRFPLSFFNSIPSKLSHTGETLAHPARSVRCDAICITKITSFPRFTLRLSSLFWNHSLGEPIEKEPQKILYTRSLFRSWNY